ncbi:MAG: ATP-binding protein [Dehalococcoidales bacterium]|nr:ATP-binding protein [Dehalococcoidales bacterium]
MAAEEGEWTNRHQLQSDLEGLRGEVFQLTAWASLGLVGFLITTLVLPPRKSVSDFEVYSTLSIAAATVATSQLASWIHRRVGRVYVSAAILISGLGLVLGTALFLVHNEYLAAWYSLLVILAGSLRGERAALTTGAVAVVILAGTSTFFGVVTESTAVSASLFIAATALVVCVSSHPIRTSLAWAWSSHLRSLQKTEELRGQQVELSRTTERLRLANLLLEHANRELRRAREAADQARRLKAQFAASVSHELRTPLNHIVGFAEMMVNKPRVYGAPLPARYKADLEAIYRSARHLSTLIDDVLDLSQVEAGRMALLKEESALPAIVREAVAVVSGIFNAKGLELVVDLPGDHPTIYVDRTRIRQVIINLLNNAARFTERGHVKVTVSTNGKDALVSISDTGIGIAHERLAEVFEEFHQLDSSTSRRYGGSGLGLAICKRFVEMHGGSIRAASEPGQGSTFTFSLPLASNRIATIVPLGHRDPQPNTVATEDAERTVAVLSDDPAVPRMLQRYMDRFRVLSVSAGVGIDAVVGNQSIDALVVTAASTQEAWQELQRAAEALGEIPLVACCLPHKRGTSQDLGLAGRIVKPVTSEALQAQLRRLKRRVRTALVVDDDADTVRLLTRMVQTLSGRCRVYTAISGEEALHLLRVIAPIVPDVVLLDLMMPGLDGYGVLQQMQEDSSLAGVPVVAITGQGDPYEVSVVDSMIVTRGGGLTAGEILPCLTASLSALLT